MLMQGFRLRLPLLSLQAATLVSWFGDSMSNLALPWFVLQATGSPTQAGLSALARTIGVYGATTLSGPYVDKLPGKRLSICCDLLPALSTVAIPLFWAARSLEAWQLYALVFTASVVQRPGFLARNRSLPEIADASGVTLERASGLNEVLYQSTLLIGPALAGVLVATLGSSWVLGLDALTFLLSAALIALGVPARLMSLPPSLKPAGSDWSYRARFIEGLRFLQQDRLLLSMVSTVALGILLVNAPLLSVMLQVYARERLGKAVELGLLFSCFAIGALTGAALFTWIGPRLPGRTLWITAYALISLPYLVIALDLPWPILAGSLALFGLAEGLSTPFYAIIRFRRVPAELRGRVFSTLTPVTGLAPSLGLIIPTVFLARIGITGVSTLLFGAILIVWLWLLITPTFRQLEYSPSR